MVEKERVEELRQLYKDIYGVTLSTDEATAMAERLVALYRELTRQQAGTDK
jgi:aldehyde:ferredoxin oxidoreductase